MAGAARKAVGPLVRRPSGAARYSNLEHRLLLSTGRAIGDFALVRPGDRLLVALSGGPASTALCALLEQHRRRFDRRFDLVPVHLAGRTASSDKLARLLDLWGLRLEAVPWRPAGGRRGAVREATERCRQRGFRLRTEARRLGCNKLADGLLLDDFLEHLLDNLLRPGRMATLPVKKAGADGLTVVRPLVYVTRQEAAGYAAELGLPAGLDEPRPPDRALEAARDILQRLGAQFERVQESMLGALGHVRESHLLDARLFSPE